MMGVYYVEELYHIGILYFIISLFVQGKLRTLIRNLKIGTLSPTVKFIKGSVDIVLTTKICVLNVYIIMIGINL
jgi:hypothetical protein